jgi:predicted kinase
MTLYLIRGLPGSGKSTYAKQIGCFHVEADMYHCRDGEYAFDGGESRLGHDWCQKAALFAMEQGMDVCVSNTFTQKWEIQPYLDFADKTGHEVKIIHVTTEYRTIHGVPAETMQKMKDRWENIEGEEEV